MTALVTEKLPLLAAAPNGILSLRALILDLAVRGRLCKQDPADQDAATLLARLKSEQVANKPSGKRRGVAAEGVATPETLFELPKGWSWASIADLAEVVRGVTYGKADARDEPGAGLLPLLRGNNINGTLNFDKLVYVPASLVSDEQMVRAGDLVIAMSSGSADLVGKAAQAVQDFQGGFGAFCGVVRSKSAELHRYLGFFVKTPFYRRSAAGQGKGIGINNLQKTALLALSVPVPPLAEQHRIVAKVNELMALCDRLEAEQADAEAAHAKLVEALLASLTQARDAADFRASWQQLAEHFHTLFSTEASVDALKQTVLQLGIAGRLVPQDEAEEPASALLRRIAVHKADTAAHRRVRQSVGVSGQAGPATTVEPPTGWCWATFGDATICRDGERVPVSQLDREHRENVYDYYGASGVIDKIDGYLFDKPLLLIGEDGANLINRSTPIAFIARGKYWVNNHAHVIDGVTEDLLKYLEIYVNAIDLKPYVTGTAQPKMNQAKLNSIRLALPPEAEQRRIVAKVDELMALCEQLKLNITQARQHHAHLAAVLVEQAVA